MAAERAVGTLMKIDWHPATAPSKSLETADLTLTNDGIVKNNLGFSKPLLIFFETKKQQKSRSKKKSKRVKLTKEGTLSAKIDTNVFQDKKWSPQIGALYFYCIRVDLTNIENDADYKFFNTKKAPKVFLIDEKGVIRAKFKNVSSSKLVSGMHKLMVDYKTDLKKTIKDVRKHLSALFKTEKELYLCKAEITKLEKKQKKKKKESVVKKIKQLEEEVVTLNKARDDFIEKYRSEIKEVKLAAVAQK